MPKEADIDKTSGFPIDSFAGYDDAYGEGFTDGRHSMAASVAKLLLETMTNEAISEVTGLPIAAVAAIRNPESENADSLAPSGETVGAVLNAEIDDVSPFSIVRDNPIAGTTLVEPSFVRLVRLVNDLTQASLAKLLSVHERTVCTWETAETPIRMKTATYSKLLDISDTKPGNPESGQSSKNEKRNNFR